MTKLGGQTAALTFDDGPDPYDTPRLLEVLEENHVKAVFCLWGDFVEQSPQVAADLGMQPLGWQVTIEDWETQDPDALAGRLESRIRSNAGGVVLMHDGPAMDRSGTVEAVARVIPELAAEGWRFSQPDRRG